MPCFKGLAVSIHTPNGPLSEYSVQKASRLSRISTYIPVPPAKVPLGSSTNIPEQSTFAISITLLTPGQDVPYSIPKPTLEDPYPHGKIVGGLPGHSQERGKYTSAIGPYIPLTTSPNETIAAYIYFDGRAKEEVATLLRKGEETWVNSRWVGVPESEGGGLAEREFLFREVGLERWLNGLDLDGKDAAATIERRLQKLDKRRRKRKEEAAGSDEETNGVSKIKPPRRKSTLRYGPNGEVEDLSDDDGTDSGTGTSDDDDPIPETAGQIKVALFRVLASGEIKRGEYSPQFDAHDDDEDSQKNGHTNGEGKSDGADVDHTTSFAKPKTLDPKSISTQTVTGIDPTDKPYAVFTFLYRGERQLQKMGILNPPKAAEKTPASSKRRSVHTDFTSLGPLKKEGTVGFTNFREEPSAKIKTKGKKASDDDMSEDSDEDAGIVGKMEDLNDADVPIKKEGGSDLLSPEDAERTGQVADGIRKMKVGRDRSDSSYRHGLRYYQLKRQHSAEPLNSNGNTMDGPRKNSKSGSPSAASTPADTTGTTPPMLSAGPSLMATPMAATTEFKGEESDFVGSPFKRQRASMAGIDDRTANTLSGLGMGIGEVLGGGGIPGTAVLSPVEQNSKVPKLQFGGPLKKNVIADDDEEL
jgi:hypothetical protein